MTREEASARLYAVADKKYKEFNDKLANCQIAPSIGVRVPDIRKIAKEIAAGNWEEYLQEMELLETKSSGMIHMPEGRYEAPSEAAGLKTPILQEEHMLQGIVIGTAKMTREQRTRHLNRWIPGVLSWGDCDCSVSSFKFMKKEQEFWFMYLCGWLDTGREFEVRVALVALMQYFMNDTYIDRVLGIVSKDYRASFSADTPESYDSVVGTSGKSTQASFSADVPYYIRMAQAWALSVCFVKYRDKTWEVLARQDMDPWVLNKAIQKCRESFRVSREDKELLLSLKVKA